VTECFFENYLTKCERKLLSPDPCHCTTPRTISQNRPYLVKDLSNMKRLTATSSLVTIFTRSQWMYSTFIWKKNSCPGC